MSLLYAYKRLLERIAQTGEPHAKYDCPHCKEETIVIRPKAAYKTENRVECPFCHSLYSRTVWGGDSHVIATPLSEEDIRET